VTLLALLYLLIHVSIPSKLIEKLRPQAASSVVQIPNYRENNRYARQRSMFSVYQPQPINIVMLGDSLTEDVDWNELLSRTDIANRGIGGDTLTGFLERLDDVYAVQPRRCFIMGGVNDIRQNVPLSEILDTYKAIVEKLLSHEIQPIIQSTLYIAPPRPNVASVNQKIQQLNTLLLNYSREKSIAFVDVNASLSTDEQLKPEHTYDGVHLVGEAYKAWRETLMPVLQTDSF
jgi:lysophospholipase L1-like esterase